MSPGLASIEGGKNGTPLEFHVLFLGLLLGGANVERRGDNQEQKLLIDSV